MSKMKAVWLTSPKTLEVGVHERPEVLTGQVSHILIVSFHTLYRAVFLSCFLSPLYSLL